MKVDKLLEGIDILIDYRIKQAIGEKIQDLNKRGVLSSSFAPNLIVSTGFVELNKQLLLTIEDFNKFKLLKDSEINHLKQYLNQIVEKQGSSLSSEAYKRTNIACEMNDLEFLKKESGLSTLNQTTFLRACWRY